MNQPLSEKMLRYRGARGRFDVFAGHIVLKVDECTCDAAEFGHRPECGWEPVMSVAEFRELSEEDLGRLLRRAGRAWCRLYKVVQTPEDHQSAINWLYRQREDRWEIRDNEGNWQSSNWLGQNDMIAKGFVFEEVPL